MKQWLATIVLLGLGGLGLAQTVTVGLHADPPNLDPLLSTALVDRQVQNQIFDKLVDLDENLRIVPMLATRWRVEDNGTTYVFTLRQGVRFHDGTEFNAEAVKFNLNRYRNAPGSRRAGELSLITNVQVVNPTTVRVTLREPFAPFLSILSDRAGMMVSPTAVQRLGAEFGSNPVGTGPFRFVERRRHDRIVLARNENYWQRGYPRIEQLVFRPFPDDDVRVANLLAGAVTIITPVAAKDLAAIRNNPNLVVNTAPSLGFQGIRLNHTRGPFANRALRQAFAATIDREVIDRVVFQGTAIPANGPFPPGTLGHDNGIPVPRRDLALARQRLAEGGHPRGFSFTLTIAPGPANAKLAQVYQAMAAEAGIQIRIEQMEFGTMLERASRLELEAVMLGWSGRPDPDANIFDFVRCNGPFNYSGYCNSRLDTLLNRARTVRLPDARQALYSQINRIIQEDLPQIFVFHPQITIGQNRHLSGIPLIPDGILRFKRASLGSQ
jgi:peptide/nickel transport system substrate-binding protein